MIDRFGEEGAGKEWGKLRLLQIWTEGNEAKTENTHPDLSVPNTKNYFYLENIQVKVKQKRVLIIREKGIDKIGILKAINSISGFIKSVSLEVATFSSAPPGFRVYFRGQHQQTLELGSSFQVKAAYVDQQRIILPNNSPSLKWNHNSNH